MTDYIVIENPLKCICLSSALYR